MSSHGMPNKADEQEGRKRLTRLLSEAAERLGNPVAMIDTSYRLLAFSPNRAKDDPLWNELVAEGTFGEETVRFFNQARFIQEVADADDITLLRHNNYKYDRYCCKFFDDRGIQLGSICVVECHRPFKPGDAEAIREVGAQMAAETQRADGLAVRESVFGGTLISPLLEQGRSLADGEVEALNDLHEKLRRYLYAVVIDISGYDPTLSHLAYMRDLLAAAMVEHPCFVHLNSVVALVSSDSPLLVPGRDMRELRDFLERYPIQAGVSGVFQDIFRLRGHYEQALAALNYGMNGGCSNRLHLYDSYRLLHAASASRSPGQVMGLVHPVVTAISEADKQDGTSRRATLCAYLANGKDEAAACRRLGVESEDLRRDIDAMCAAYDIDMNDGMMLFSLFGSCMMMEIIL